MATSSPDTTTVLSLADARSQFAGARRYLAACTTGLPTHRSRAAILADVDAATAGRIDATAYTATVERCRQHFARMVDVDASRVAIGSQTSVFAGFVAAALPDEAEVVCVEGDFASIVMPFVQAGRGIRVRVAPLEGLADAIGPDTALVAFSLVQSATGEVADAAAIVAAARRHHARTLCDATQAVGWLPVAASDFDALVCHAYKWLCSPRGVAFLAVSEEFGRGMRPIYAGWYAGADPWSTCYGHEIELADDASRFDVSPAWQAFVGAEYALELFAAVDADAVHEYTTGLARAFRDRLGLPTVERESAIVTWPDPDGADLARLKAAGIAASGRAGRARVAFHLFNDADDVDAAARAIGR